ncbi:DUF397 domain-containing protein [Nonomuraea sp. NPDC046802]|uniref:DUF397 domain-containing protein n=1 Tax=Nonomuraea sp. NPDC046802 TaxID=3154919 RepID=UPI00340C2A36
MRWIKSSFCNGASTCVEVAPLPGGGAVIRDGKDPDGSTLRFTPAEWAAFTAGVRGGQFEPGALRAHAARVAGDGGGVDGHARGCSDPETVHGAGDD